MTPRGGRGPAPRAILIEAIHPYDAVAADFGPHEFGDSSRCREAEAAIEKYGLAEDLVACREARPDDPPQRLREAS